MALVNYERRFIYLMEPHMASRATADAVQKYVKGTAEVGHHHMPLSQLTDWRRQQLDAKQVRGFRVVCSVRNPFDTLVTRWRQGALKDKPLSHARTLQEDHPILSPSRGMDKDATHIAMYEDLQSDLQWLFTQPDLELSYNPMHKTPGKAAWHEYYDDETFDYLYNRPDWQEYMTKYGYRIYRDGGVELDRDVRVVITQQL